MRPRSDEPMVESTSNDRRDDDEPVTKRRRGNNLDGLAREIGLMRDGFGSSSATFVGSASGIHFIRSVYGAIGSPTATSTSPEANIVPGEDDQLAAAARPIWHDQETIESGQVPFDNLLAMTESYFDLWHPAFPFLHAPSVLGTLEHISCGNTQSLHQWDLVIVKSIMSIALADRRQTGQSDRPAPKSLLFHTFDDALQSIQVAMARPATIAGLQAVICVELFLISMLRLNVASRLGGLIVQMAFQLGLHRCPARFSSFAIEEKQLRKRVWWTIYILERYTCQALGLPLLIQDADADVCFPNREKHTDEVGCSPPDPRMQLLELLAQHAQLRGTIVELRNKRVEERDKNPETALYINARLTKWWNDIEDILDQDSSAVSQLHTTVLETLKHESTIMLNRPLLALSKDTASFASAVEACIAAAKSLLARLNSLQTMSANTFTAMMWPSFTWAAWMSAFIVMYAVAEGKVTAQVATRSVERSMKVLNALATRGSVWPQACAVAIEDLQKTLLQRHEGQRNLQLLPSTYAFESDQALHSVSSMTPRTNARPEPPLKYPPAQFQGSGPSLQPREESRSSQNDSSLHLQHSVGINDRSTPYTPAVNSHQLPDLDWFNVSGFSYNNQPMSNISDPLQSFDIPFWLGADNTLAWMNNNM